MENSIYKDIETRTGGDIYMGVVGPCRTGKSTFITKFMDTLVLPFIEDQYEKERITDELPQSGDGKTIMTTQPHFVPNEGVNVSLGDNVSLNMRLIDCVGYIVEGALGHMEEEMPRMVTTPWSNDPMPFDKAADMGTKKVITDHSTVGIVITTDGTITGIDKANYADATHKAIKQLKELGKPFTVLINSKNPSGDTAQQLKAEMEEKYDMPITVVDVMNMSIEDIQDIIKNILFDFPLKSICFNLPDWINALPKDHRILTGLTNIIEEKIDKLEKMRDYNILLEGLRENEDFSSPQVEDISLGTGNIDYNMDADKKLFYKVIEEESGFNIDSDYHLMKILKDLLYSKTQYDKVKSALLSTTQTGYGVITPSLEDINLKKPEMIKQGNKFAVKLFANAPTIHMIRTDVTTEVCPIVGSEDQSTNVLDFLNEQFDANKDDIWQTNIFGKSLQDVVNDGLSGKNIPEESRKKLTNAMQKMANQDKRHLICFVI